MTTTPPRRSRRTPKPPPAAAELEALDRLTDRLPKALRAFRDRGILSPQRRFRLEEAIRHRTRSLVVVLHGVHDPHNQAAVMRTCEALGIQEVHVVSEHEVDLRPSPRVTQNAHRWLDVKVHESFSDLQEELRDRGFALMAAALAQGATPLLDIDFTQCLALVFGNESEGLPDEVVSTCDGTFSIPLHGLSQSLNISVAVAVTLHWGVESRRRIWGKIGDLSDAERMELRHRYYQQAARGHIPPDLNRDLQKLS